MKPLDHLSRQLVALCRQAQRVRLATAASGAAIALLIVLVAIFAVDWLFRESGDIVQRIVLLGLGVAALVWAFVRYALPWLGGREEPLEMALRLQRHVGIDSDLIAALQFEGPPVADGGSPALKTALVDDVAARQRDIKVDGVVQRGTLLKRLRVLGLLGLPWAALGLLIPSYVGVFFNRLLLGAQQYPTRTQFMSLTVNGKPVDLSRTDAPAVRVPYGRPLVFAVEAMGVTRDDKCRVEMTGSKGGLSVFDLEARPEAPRAPDAPPPPPAPSGYAGKYDRLLEDASCKVYLGDAWTRPLEVTVIPSPMIEVEPEIVPPRYAQADDGPAVRRLPRGTRQFAVVEGSEVKLNVSSDRPLKAVTLMVGDAKVEYALDKEASRQGAELWVPKLEGTPLAAVAEPLKYAIDVLDAEEQTLERPLEGYVRIEPDQPPRIAAATKTPFVLPVAQPTNYYGVSDDHAVGRIWLTWEVLRGDAPLAAEGGGSNIIELFQLEKDEKPEPVLEGEYAFDLGKLPLAKGDTVKIVFHATDYRGKNPGKSTASEPLVFQVTDEQGIMASLLEGDQKSARELELFIKQLLGLGESP